MGQVVHIVFDAGIKKNLLETFKQIEEGLLPKFNTPSKWFDNCSVLVCSDPLIYGPIFEMDEPEGFYKRLDWLEQFVMAHDSTVDAEDHAYDLSEAVSDFYKKLAWLSVGQKVVIWHTPFSNDQIGLRMLSYLLGECELYEVILQTEADVLCVQETLCELKTFGTEQLAKYLANIQKISSEGRKQFKLDWEALRSTKGTLRIFSKGKVSTVPDHYFDDELANLVLRGDLNQVDCRLEAFHSTTVHKVDQLFLSSRLKML